MPLDKITVEMLVDGDLPYIEKDSRPEDVALFHEAIALLVPEADGSIPLDRVDQFIKFALQKHGEYEIQIPGGKPISKPLGVPLKQFAMDYWRVLIA